MAVCAGIARWEPVSGLTARLSVRIILAVGAAHFSSGRDVAIGRANIGGRATGIYGETGGSNIAGLSA